MKIKLFKKDIPVKFTEYNTLFWNESEPKVQFKAVLDLIKECDLELVDMIYYPGGNPMLDYRCSIKFGVEGTLQNLELFKLRAYQNHKLRQFF